MVDPSFQQTPPSGQQITSAKIVDNTKTNSRFPFGKGFDLQTTNIIKAMPKTELCAWEIRDLDALKTALRQALDRDMRSLGNAGNPKRTGYVNPNLAEELMTSATHTYGIVSNHRNLLTRLARTGDVDKFLKLAELAVKAHLMELTAGRGRLEYGVDVKNRQQLEYQDLYINLNITKAVEEALVRAQTDVQIIRLLAVLAGDNLETHAAAKKGVKVAQMLYETRIEKKEHVGQSGEPVQNIIDC